MIGSPVTTAHAIVDAGGTEQATALMNTFAAGLQLQLSCIGAVAALQAEQLLAGFGKQHNMQVYDNSVAAQLTRPT
jgi:hypothetical protein